MPPAARVYSGSQGVEERDQTRALGRVELIESPAGDLCLAMVSSDRLFRGTGTPVVEEGAPEQVFSSPSQVRTQAFLRKIL